MLRIFRFWRWILAVAICIGGIVFVASEQHTAAEEYKSERKTYCAAFFPSTEQQAACIEETASPKDYLPWWYVLVSWPEGITVWALIATCGAIVWQAIVAGRAAHASQISAEASKKAAMP